MMRIPLAVVQLPPKVQPAGDGGVGEVAGPFLAWCFKPYPTGDDKLMCYALHNLPDDATVEWAVAEAEFVDVVGPDDGHVLIVRSNGGSSTVTATVNGETIGSAPITFDDCE
jgi:hypothetical protein